MVRVTMIPIVFGPLGTVLKGLERRLEYLEIKGRTETIQNITLLRTAKILRRDLMI